MARSLDSLILQRLATVKNATVGAAIGHDESHVSRVASGERGLRLAEIEPFLSALGLAVIECDGEVVSMPAKRAAALAYLAAEALAK